MAKTDLRFTQYFADRPNPRVNCTQKHRLDEIVVISLDAVICGRAPPPVSPPAALAD